MSRPHGPPCGITSAGRFFAGTPRGNEQCHIRAETEDVAGQPGVPCDHVRQMDDRAGEAERRELSSPGVLGLAYQDGDIASIWLKDQSQTSAVVRTLNLPQNQSAAHIQEVLSGESLKLMFNDPLHDERIPDIVLIPHLGGIYLDEDSKFIAEHGGFNDQDTNVALIVANPRLSARVIKTPVQTTQIAPTILKALGLNASALQAVQREGTSVLPGGPLDSPPSAPKRARAPGGSAFR